MTTHGYIRIGLLAGLSLLAQAGDAPVLYADSAPVLTSAAVNHTHVVLTVTHLTATEFSVRIIYQDEGITQPTEGMVPKPQWKRIAQGQFVVKLKIPGDTNDFSVAVSGSTNWSNSIRVIP
jgi:hypothetical protein